MSEEDRGEPTAAEPIRVLHVDDEPDFLELAATHVERADARLEVETVTDAASVLDRLERGDIDCLVADYDMPDRTGIELLETVRTAAPDLPFILFTGKGSEEVAAEAIAAGVTDYLQKEVGSDQFAVLANRIGNAVEHVRSRRLVAEGDRRLRQVIDALPHLLYVVDASGTYRLANEPLATFHGTTVDAIEGTHVTEVLEEDAAAGFLEDLEAVLTTDAPTSIPPVEIVSPEGDTHVFDPRLIPYEVGGDRAVLGVAVDVTERRAGELELEVSRERMELALEHTSAVIFEIDLETGGLVRHGTFERFFDHAPEELPSWEDHCERAVHPEDREAFRRFHLELIDGARTGGEIVYRTNPERGPLRWIAAHVHVADASTGDGRRALGISRDVTERVERERSLEALNEVSRRLMGAETRTAVAEIGVEASRDVLGLEANAIHLHDDARDALIPMAATEAVTELVGEPPVFTPGDSIAWRVFDDGEAVALDAVREDPDVYDPDSPVVSELLIPIPSRGVLLASSTEPEAFGRQDVVLGELLVGSIARALEQVERTEELRARERDLRHQNERLEAFASVVSHDLRNPLALARGHLELAAEECDSEHLETVAEGHERMETLIDDLLTMARQGATVSDLEPVELDDFITRCWTQLDTAEATLRVEVGRTVQADRNRLRQLLENLLRNAVEHGGSDVAVTMGALEDGFYVEDDGPGIPATDRESVFDAGYSTSPTGTGFGLPIVQEVATAHGWSVRATEAAGGGARFEFTGVDFVD